MFNKIEKSFLKRIWLAIQNYFVPGYTETEVFLMAISLVLLSLFNADLKLWIQVTISSINNTDSDRVVQYVLGAGGLFISGLILSIFHAFSSKRKSETVKTIILVFALGISGVAGIIASMRIIKYYYGLFLVFPVLNIFSSIILLYLIGFASGSMMDDGDAPKRDLFIGSVVVITTFLLCNFWFDFHWSITFSICVAYAMNINELLCNLIQIVAKKRIASDAKYH